jgi:hypothetical protein
MLTRLEELLDLRAYAKGYRDALLADSITLCCSCSCSCSSVATPL